ncbi:MAG: ShlB/FhaC/HecB family hemolysin secretion/activation protein [Zoogloeaceae bacterium]|jgi:hemolysin activation/secretion protein|nr:ShlB/FhaC/HecB family hemolysin secretion/activation protein [Zoogloeaceae bacterium]
MPTSSVLAQGAPSSEAAAQELLRQQERERALRQQQEQTPDVRLQGSRPAEKLGRLPLEESPCFDIRRITLEGELSEQFQWALDAADRADDGEADVAAGRCLGAQGINLVMKRIQNAIIERGFVTTRVLAKPQDIRSGALNLTLIPGRIRNIRFTADSSSRATRWNAVPIRSGDLLNLREIEQALENFKRVPTVEADIQITPTEGEDAQPGDSDLVIAWQQGIPFRITLAADNFGTRTTGKYQGSATLSADHLLMLNDLFYISFNRDLGGKEPGARGTRGRTAHYSLPFGYWLLSLTGSEYNYHQEVAGNAQNYIYSGDSASREARLSRIVYRDARRKTSLFVSGWQRSWKNFIDDTEIEVQRRRMAGWEAGIEHREFIANAMLNLNASYRRGTGAFHALPAPEESFGEGTARSKIIYAGAQLDLPFSIGAQRWRYAGTLRGQKARTALVPQDRFMIGGFYTVRGFDGRNTLMAESGWLFRNDVGMALGDSGQELYFGIDAGRVSGPSSRYLLGTSLSGAAIGLRGGWKGAAYDLFWGVPVSKPAGFQTAHHVFGINTSWSF